MPDRRLAKTRLTLDRRYQFGDAGVPDIGPGSVIFIWDPVEDREVRIDFPIDSRVKGSKAVGDRLTLESK